MLVPSLAVLFLFASTSAQWIKQSVDTQASFRGLSVVSEKVVWASGTGGTVIKTTDGGTTWRVMKVPGADKLDFRDIEAFDRNTAYILSIGNGDSSRIYKTVNGGESWALQFTNSDPKAFFDAIACWDASNCVAMSDPVDNRFVLISTVDGTNWTKPGTDRRSPPAKTEEGEAAFAASGTCLLTRGKSELYLVSGGTNARVFSSRDRGETWSVAEAPVAKGTSGSGVFSIAMAGEKFGVVVGGNYEKPEVSENTLAVTHTASSVWAGRSGLSGYRSGVTFVDDRTIIAVGTNGSDMSTDQGITWQRIGSENLNSIAARGRRSVWAVGPGGGVFKLR
jgi:photosystem II stability/assembly factor-like uncharacterized protein